MVSMARTEVTLPSATLVHSQVVTGWEAQVSLVLLGPALSYLRCQEVPPALEAGPDRGQVGPVDRLLRLQGLKLEEDSFKK